MFRWSSSSLTSLLGGTRRWVSGDHRVWAGFDAGRRWDCCGFFDEGGRRRFRLDLRFVAGRYVMLGGDGSSAGSCSTLRRGASVVGFAGILCWRIRLVVGQGDSEQREEIVQGGHLACVQG